MAEERRDAFSTLPFNQQYEFQLLYQRLTYFFGSKNLSEKGENSFDWAHMIHEF